MLDISNEILFVWTLAPMLLCFGDIVGDSGSFNYILLLNFIKL
jgi:hypothetical protein